MHARTSRPARPARSSARSGSPSNAQLAASLHHRPVRVARALARSRHSGVLFVAGSPARAALMAFMVIMGFFTALLKLPVAAEEGQSTSFVDAMFTAISAVSVTGLTVVNTAEHWSFAGQAIILVGIQIGGLGILSTGGLLGLAVSRRLGLRSRLVTQEGMTTGRLGEVKQLLLTVVITSLTFEALLALVLVPRFIAATGSFAEGLWQGTFYSVSAFNNAGFTLHPEGFGAYVDDPWIIWAVMIGVMLGSLGFPVVLVFHRCLWHRGKLNLHTKITLEMTAALLLLGAVLLGWFEWDNRDTLGEMSIGERLQFALFASTMTRSGGFSVYDMNDQNPESLLLMDALMFVGGGSGSTAGGIKVTTLAVLLLAIIAEARGAEEVTSHHRTINAATIRVAIAVVMAAATLILVATMVLLAMTHEPLHRVMFETLSAFGTVGLTTGLSEDLPPAGRIVLSLLMFAGRVGTITFAAGLALRQRRTLYRHPEERPIIG